MSKCNAVVSDEAAAVVIFSVGAMPLPFSIEKRNFRYELQHVLAVVLTLYLPFCSMEK